MAEKATYRLQVILPEAWRIPLSAVAHEDYVSVQKLMEGVVHDLLEQRGKLDTSKTPKIIKHSTR